MFATKQSWLWNDCHAFWALPQLGTEANVTRAGGRVFLSTQRCPILSQIYVSESVISY